jgi:hypothetical protein
VANSPTNFVDPRGLDIAVIENGPVGAPHGYNPFGHTAIAITGRGLFSYGNGNGGEGTNMVGDSLADYISREGPRRRTAIWVIQTTPEQDAAAAAAAYAMDHEPILTRGGILSDNCSTRSNRILDAAGVPNYGTWMPDAHPGSGGRRAFHSGASGYEIPKGSTTIIPWNPNAPYDFSQFEPNLHGRK